MYIVSLNYTSNLFQTRKRNFNRGKLFLQCLYFKDWNKILIFIKLFAVLYKENIPSVECISIITVSVEPQQKAVEFVRHKCNLYFPI